MITLSICKETRLTMTGEGLENFRFTSVYKLKCTLFFCPLLIYIYIYLWNCTEWIKLLLVVYENFKYNNSSHKINTQTEKTSEHCSYIQQGVCFVTGRKEENRVRKFAHSRKSSLVKNITFVSCHNLRVHGTSCLASSWIALEKPRSEQKWPAAITPKRKEHRL